MRRNNKSPWLHNAKCQTIAVLVYLVLAPLQRGKDRPPRSSRDDHVIILHSNADAGLPLLFLFLLLL